MVTNDFVATTQHDWNTNPRWKGITRPYTPEDVDRLRGTIRIDYSIAVKIACISRPCARHVHRIEDYIQIVLVKRTITI